MYKIQSLILFILRFYVTHLVKSCDVYVISGLRRSGNHALTSWLVDSLEEKNNVKMHRKGEIWVSESEKTVHLNEANLLTLLHFIDILRENKKYIKKANNLFITFEDYIPRKRDPFIPKNARKIKATRSLLNVISSRLKRLNDQAKIGLDRGDMSINRRLVMCARWLNGDSDQEWATWTYEKWLSDAQYRESFLKSLNLQFDSKIEPSSNFGGGSSFSNVALGKSGNNPLERWKQIEFPDRVVALIHNECLPLLQEKERHYIESEFRLRKLGG